MQEWLIQIRLSGEKKKERERKIERERLRTKLVESWIQKMLGKIMNMIKICICCMKYDYQNI